MASVNADHGRARADRDDKTVVRLRDDNAQLTRFLRVAHETCGAYHDVTTASFIGTWIDETERRTDQTIMCRAGEPSTALARFRT